MGQVIHPFKNLSSFMVALDVTNGLEGVTAINTERIHNSVGTPHGGFISSLLNASAMQSMQSDGVVSDVVSDVDGDVRAELSTLNVSYLSVANPDQRMIATSQVLSASRYDVMARSALHADGKKIAEARLGYRFVRLSGDQNGSVQTAAYQAPDLFPKLKPSSGLETVQEAAEKNMPPYMEALGIEFEEVALGRVSLKMPDLNPEFVDRDGFVDPSIVVSLADCLGLAGRTVIDGGRYTMSGLEVNLLEPLKAQDAPLRVVGTVTKPGAKNVVVQADVLGSDNQWKATATLGCMPLPESAHG